MSPGADTAAEQLKSLRRKAANLNREKSWDLEAIEINTMLLQLDPVDIAAYCRRGKCHRLREDLESARADYERALALSADTSSTKPLIEQAISEIRGELQTRIERERAEEAERAERERARHAELDRQQRILEGLASCDEAAAAAREARSAELPDLDFALALYKRAAELDTARLDIGVEWAALLRETGQARKALRIYDRILELRPDNRAARVGKAAILVDYHHADAALEICDAILAEHPDDGYARRVKARAHAARGEMPEAVFQYEQAS